MLANVRGLFLDALVLIFVLGMLARGCALVLVPLDAALDRIAGALSLAGGSEP